MRRVAPESLGLEGDETGWDILPQRIQVFGLHSGQVEIVLDDRLHIVLASPDAARFVADELRAAADMFDALTKGGAS